MIMKISTRLNKLADFIKSKPMKMFDLHKIDPNEKCGTAGCILGWASVLYPKGGKIKNPFRNHQMNHEDVHNLMWATKYKNPTRFAALQRLRATANKYAAGGD